MPRKDVERSATYLAPFLAGRTEGCYGDRRSRKIARCVVSGTITYTIQLRPEPEGGFTVLVPALPEIVSYGETEEDALQMAEEAIALCLEVRRDEGEPIPEDVVPLVRQVSVFQAAPNTPAACAQREDDRASLATRRGSSDERQPPCPAASRAA
ncbi:type II toxin-antitoxin system HicB family antitoxin [Jiella avicenniae]|uniref:Type II toxin-antitoxin system HicB family antitoxin n=1 Tax=Jiella avicenniae TaxID=2907202 RepID=A0A9X1TC24_9HYPH|nr:type II toxin-antitoxin system HicB family antitoxin [Jiella avicenniae]MCE7028633.1 type II toxin-antitoxin system HicB family antitoxin [Jiella avicenniae]